MKKQRFLWMLAATLTVCGAMVSLNSCTISEDNPVIEKDKFTFQAVDLGLSVKWANANIGADSEEGFGDYYAWGVTEVYYTYLEPFTWKPNGQQGDETVVVTWKEGKEYGYSWDSYQWVTWNDDGSGYITKYNNDDGKMVLDADDDVAHVKLGGKWRMPSKEEFDELINNCNWTWEQRKGIAGYVVSSKKDGNRNSIFIPAAGGAWHKGNGIVNVQGLYWANSYATKSPRSAYCLKFTNEEAGIASGKYRPNGFPIRAVKE